MGGLVGGDLGFETEQIPQLIGSVKDHPTREAIDMKAD
jgi:hypothetical protein